LRSQQPIRKGCFEDLRAQLLVAWEADARKVKGTVISFCRGAAGEPRAFMFEMLFAEALKKSEYAHTCFLLSGTKGGRTAAGPDSTRVAAQGRAQRDRRPRQPNRGGGRPLRVIERQGVTPRACGLGSRSGELRVALTVPMAATTRMTIAPMTWDLGSGTACLPYPEKQRVCGLCGIPRVLPVSPQLWRDAHTQKKSENNPLCVCGQTGRSYGRNLRAS
jgi:hypothetical protein